MNRITGYVLPIVSIVLLLWIEQGQDASYIVKTASKILFFLLIPLILFRKTKFTFLQLNKTDRKSLKIAIVSGFGVMAIILLAFSILQSFIDIGALLVDLQDAGITATTFPYIFIYILFINSLLEEFFFRGLLPDLFDRSRLRLLLPSFFFAIYHVAIFLPWFTPPLLALAVVGLWIGGFIFQLANEKSRTILPSWIIHMFADIGVLLIGVYMFYFY